MSADLARADACGFIAVTFCANVRGGLVQPVALFLATQEELLDGLVELGRHAVLPEHFIFLTPNQTTKVAENPGFIAIFGPAIVRAVARQYPETITFAV